MSFWGGKNVLLTGGSGFLGRRIATMLEAAGAIVKIPRSKEQNLVSTDNAWLVFETFSPQIVIHAAAFVGGIGLNEQHPARMFYENMAMGLNVIQMSQLFKVERLVLIGTTCSYPKFAPIPFREADLWNGYPEETNAPYGIAKRSLLVMARAYEIEYGLRSVCVIPTNLYGPGDNFNPTSSHVIPALVRRFVEARMRRLPEVACWGTGRPSRDFLYVDDAARGILMAAEHAKDSDPINLGTGSETTMQRLASMISEEIGFRGEIIWDPSKPDGQPRRRLDISHAKESIGWMPKISLPIGLRTTIDWYLKSIGQEP